MILIHFTPDGLKRTMDVRNTQHNQTAILLGGAPSLLQQNYKLMEQRGVLVMAMNNAARHIRPTYFVCGDNPNCYEPQLLMDPTIMKIGPMHWANTAAEMHCNGKLFRDFPNMFFYLQQRDVAWDEYLATRAEVPWYQNTILAGIHILYQLGIRRIILAGSDFMVGTDSDYAHGQQLGKLEKKWNLDLYNHVVRELRLLKPVFDKAGLKLMDCSVNSRLKQVYKQVTLEQAVDMCLEGFPSEALAADKLPHCSKFASKHIREHIAEWPGNNGIKGKTNSNSGRSLQQNNLQLVV